MAGTTFFVRIKPNSPREQHTILGKQFRKEKGWYEVSESLAKVLRDEPLREISEHSPDTGERVFDVKSKDEATAVVVSERKVEDKRGTIDEPNKVDEPAPPPADEPTNEMPGAPPKGRRLRKQG